MGKFISSIYRGRLGGPAWQVYTPYPGFGCSKKQRKTKNSDSNRKKAKHSRSSSTKSRNAIRIDREHLSQSLLSLYRAGNYKLETCKDAITGNAHLAFRNKRNEWIAVLRDGTTALLAQTKRLGPITVFEPTISNIDKLRLTPRQLLAGNRILTNLVKKAKNGIYKISSKAA